jgi:hypothetical protein
MKYVSVTLPDPRLESILHEPKTLIGCEVGLLMTNPQITEALSSLCRQRPYGDADALLLDTTCLYSSGRLVQVVVRGTPLATASVEGFADGRAANFHRRRLR